MSNGAKENWSSNGAEAEHHNLDRRSVFGGEAEGRRILMVDLVDILVKRTPMHRAMHPVVPGILQHEEDRYLVGHLVDRGKGNGGLEAEEQAHGVEEPDLDDLNGEVGEENERGALPLFVGSRDFVLRIVVSYVSIQTDGPGRGCDLADAALRDAHIPAESCTS